MGIDVCVCDSKRYGVLLYYHFSDQMTSLTSTTPFFIDVIETLWKHDDALNMDCFYGFLRCRCAPMDVPRYKPCIVDFYISWIQPMSSYYHFAMLMLKVVILS